MNYDRSKPHCYWVQSATLTTVKTTLTAAITTVLAKKGFTCKLKITVQSIKLRRTRTWYLAINTAHVEYRERRSSLRSVDCPGHADYVKNMITGAAQMDGAILVVSAADGPMPQT